MGAAMSPNPHGRRPSAPEATLPAREVARLAAAGRVASGAAYALGNALAALQAEADFLREERKHDPVVSESCTALSAELARCARMARALTERRAPPRRADLPEDGPGVDLAGLVRELGHLLQETLGSLHQLDVRAPDGVPPVAGDAATLELVVTCLVHYAADQAGGASRIRLDVEPEPAEGAVALRLRVAARELGEDVVAALSDPARAPDAVTRAGLDFVDEALRELGGQRSAAATAPDAWAALLHFPAAGARAVTTR